MNKNQIITNVILIPVIFGVILCICFSFFFSENSDFFSPFVMADTVADYDELQHPSSLGEWSGNTSQLKSNDIIGTVKIIGNDTTIRFDSDYSNMLTSLSMVKSSAFFGDSGCVCLKGNKATALPMGKEIEIDIDCISGNYKYKFERKYTEKNEYKITHSSKSSTLLIYYQNSSGAGLCDGYTVLLFREVK